MLEWRKNFKNVIQMAKWHYDNKRYDLPFDLAVGNVKL
jgi:hypothetical protein